MKVYISLPITGKDIEEQKRHAEGVASFLLATGFTPVNPFDNGLGDDAPYEEHIKADLKLMLDCDAIILYDGWLQSKGCVLESHVAIACGMTVVDARTPWDKIVEQLREKERRKGGKP